MANDHQLPGINEQEIRKNLDTFFNTGNPGQPVNFEASEILVPEEENLLMVRTANEWIEDAQNSPMPKMLFDELWYEDELCILFADTNMGKSILAVQIGNSLSKGEAIKGFRNEANSTMVLYLDFELSYRQFAIRYTNELKEKYEFSTNMRRSEMNPDGTVPDKYNSFEDYLNACLETRIKETQAKVVIIDNLTYLKTETENAKNALPLMKHLKNLKKKHGLSMLALAHTPKRDLSKPLDRNDLQGSKMLINLCDSSFAIGESTTDKNLRYIKQIKTRNKEFAYDADNVIVCAINKPSNFLRFEFLKYGNEEQHLKTQSEKDKAQIKADAMQLMQEGLSNREVGRRLGLSEGTIRGWFKKNNSEELKEPA